MILTNEDVQEILRLLDDTSYDELHLQTENFTLNLKRSGQGGWTRETRISAGADVSHLSNPEGSAAEQDSLDRQQEKSDAAPDGLKEIRAPMVGTFYQAPKPGAEPFVKIGTKVEEDTLIAIIEVMKLMNSIAAGVSGEIVDILVKDAQFVEKGQLLMRVKPAVT